MLGLGARTGRLIGHQRLSKLFSAGRGTGPAATLYQRWLGDPLALLCQVDVWTTTWTGDQMQCQSRDIIERSVLVSGQWEPGVTRVLTSLLRNGDTFVDVGANIGVHALLAAHLVGPTGCVVGIEASPLTYERLIANLNQNDYSQVRAIHAAVSDELSEVLINEGPRHNRGHTTIAAPAGTAGERVMAAPLDELLLDSPMASALVIKVDIEGSEGQARLGIERVLAAGPPDSALIIETSEDNDWLLPAAERLGMRALLIPGGYRRAVRYARHIPAPTPVSAMASGVNDYLLVRGSMLERL